MRSWILVGVLLAFAPGATAQGLAQKLIGAWSCEADEAVVKLWTSEYFADGGVVMIRGDNSGMQAFADDGNQVPVRIVTMLEGKWREQPDGMLFEQLARVVNTVATINNSIKAPMGDEMGMTKGIEDRPFSSTVTPSIDKFTAVANDGIVTTCERRKTGL